MSATRVAEQITNPFYFQIDALIIGFHQFTQNPLEIFIGTLAVEAPLKLVSEDGHFAGVEADAVSSHAVSALVAEENFS